MFSRHELETYTVKELKQLARWYEVKHANNIGKEALLDLLVETLYVESEDENADGVQMSTRVRRLKELNK